MASAKEKDQAGEGAGSAGALGDGGFRPGGWKRCL